jgi:riboflavin synthase alpha subunit
MFTGIITDVGTIAELKQAGDLRARLILHMTLII